MQDSAQAASSGNRWVQAWPDLLAFAGGLSMAWFLEWDTTDLVWSLWLSSFVVGYATIIWIATRPLREFSTAAAADPMPGMVGPKMATGGVHLVGALFVIAFFTVHFGGFHFGHSVFLAGFFPLETGTHGWPGWSTYAEVVKRYWVFLPAAFLAERAAFVSKPAVEMDDGSVTADAIARREARNTSGGDLFAPYKNVIRMHLLIFFFAGISFVNLDYFAVYAVVYAVYFFPWRLLKREKVEI